MAFKECVIDTDGTSEYGGESVATFVLKNENSTMGQIV